MDELVAKDEDDYVRIAVRLGTDPAFRHGVRERIRRSVHLLYMRDEAVDAWAEMLTRLAEAGPPAANESAPQGSSL